MFGLFKKEPFSNMPKEMRPVMNAAFPSGEKQLEKETKGLLSSFPTLFTFEAARGLLVWTKSYSLVNHTLSFKDICDAISRHEKGRLTSEQCAAIYTKILEQDFANQNKSS
jgi:hypothetical protein